MKSILFILLGSSVFSYGQESQCKPYFSYDHIDHLIMPIDTWSTESNAPEGAKLSEILTKARGNTLADTLTLKEGEKLGFKKIELDEAKFNAIDKVFCSNYNPGETTMCDPIFNDILIFKKAGKIVGYSKICLGCRQVIIIGKDVGIWRLVVEEYKTLSHLLNY